MLPIRAASWLLAVCFALTAAVPLSATASDVPGYWKQEWPDTDFGNATVPLDEIMSGGPPKDGIPSIDDPAFLPASEIEDLSGDEPVIRLTVGGETRLYPLRVLTWHEIVNDTVGDVPVAVTYCPLCNAAIVFRRVVDGTPTTFGTTGKLRHSDLVMYDRATESWWQQFTGEAIVGELAGERLDVLPARLMPYSEAVASSEQNVPVLVPNDPEMRDYGANPYVGYDSSGFPFLYRGEVPEGIEPMAYVVSVGDEAWAMDLLRERGTVRDGDLTLRWSPGMRSALDSRSFSDAREIGSVDVTRDGETVVHDVTFAFVHYAFTPEGTLHTRDGPVSWKHEGGD